MNFSTSIFYCLLFGLCLVAMPNEAVACGGDCCKKEQQAVEKETSKSCGEAESCCSKSTEKPTKKTPEKKDCNGKCGGKSCPCPSPSNAPIPFITTNILPQFQYLHTFFLSEKTGYYFLNVIPKPVYLSLWQPPKISC